MDPRVAGRTARRIETLHALSYFAPDVEAELTALGLRAGRMSYFAQRAAPMGPVGGGTVAATFYVFNPSLVHHFVPPRAGTGEGPPDVTAARYRGVDRRVHAACWAPTTLASSEVAEAAELARTAGRRLHGRAAGRCTPRTPTWRGRPSRTWCCSTRSPCCASTAATATSRPCCRPG